jgi:hypothetical protein
MKEPSPVRKKGVKDYLRSHKVGAPQPAAMAPEEMAAKPSNGLGEKEPGPDDSKETGTLSTAANLEAALKEAYEEIRRLKAEVEQSSQRISQLEEEDSPEEEENPLANDSDEDEDMTESDVRFRNEIYDLRNQINELQSEILEQDNIWKLKWERERHERLLERNDMSEELHLAQKETLDRRRQLLELKQSLSMLTHRENQVTDGDLLERMDGLYHRIREWVVSNFRRSQLGMRYTTHRWARASFLRSGC